MPQSGWSALGMLAVAVLILFLAYWVTKWLGTWQAKGGSVRLKTGGNEAFCVLGQLSVGRNEQLVLVRFRDSCLLLGVTANGVTLLKELDGDAAAEWLAAEERSAPPSFAEVLRDNLWKRK